MSRDARRVVNHLNTYGIDIELGGGQFDIEVSCSMFFPTHIMGVIDQILKGKNAVDKLLRAQDRGWDYFKKPIRDFLSHRTSSWQKAKRDEEPIQFAPRAYSIVVSTYLAHDINRAEADLLVYEIPELGDRDVLLHGIIISKRHSVRSVSYLHGILLRERARRTADIDERESRREKVWEPGELERIEDHLGLSDDWEQKRKSIKSKKALNAEIKRH